MADAILNLVVIRSADLERAACFYGALGIPLKRERHDAGAEHLAGGVGSAVLEIYPQQGDAKTSATRLGFRVGSLADALAAAQANGGTVTAQPQQSPWGLRAVVIDPDGHRVELIQE
jgi:lactoylglutathione lyase